MQTLLAGHLLLPCPPKGVPWTREAPAQRKYLPKGSRHLSRMPVHGKCSPRGSVRPREGIVRSKEVSIRRKCPPKRSTLLSRVPAHGKCSLSEVSAQEKFPPREVSARTNYQPEGSTRPSRMPSHGWCALKRSVCSIKISVLGKCPPKGSVHQREMFPHREVSAQAK